MTKFTSRVLVALLVLCSYSVPYPSFADEWVVIGKEAYQMGERFEWGAHFWRRKNLDENDANKIGGKSFVGLNEVHCRKRQTRVIQLNLYSESDGVGNIVNSLTEPGPWKYPEPDSVNAVWLKAICDKKTK